MASYQWISTQQPPKIGVRNSEEYGEEVRQAGGVRELWYHRLGHWIEQPKMNENEIHCGLRWPRTDEFSHNNQPKIVRQLREVVWPSGSTRGCKSISDRVVSMLKTKIKSLSLQIIIFLRPMIRYTKILLPRPWTTPSKEASGRGVSQFASAMLPCSGKWLTMVVHRRRGLF